MLQKPKKIQRIFIIYWILLAYIIAALIFWFITLNSQNREMVELRKNAFSTNTVRYGQELEKIEEGRKRKIKQYAGEGSAFLLVILTGAIFVFRAVRRQLKLSQEQQHFMMAITHELKTPISVVQLNLETIQKRNLDQEQRQRLLQNTLHETTRLNTLCNNLLLSSQIEAGGYRMMRDEIDLAELLQNCVDDFTLRYPQRHIAASIADDLYIRADPFLLQISVNNLLENALKYSPKERPVRLTVSKLQGSAQIEISDEGPGIEDEYKKKVFEKFYRLGNEATKRAKGTGLGLYLTKRIVDALNGEIFVENNVAGGSNFIVRLKTLA